MKRDFRFVHLEHVIVYKLYFNKAVSCVLNFVSLWDSAYYKRALLDYPVNVTSLYIIPTGSTFATGATQI